MNKQQIEAAFKEARRQYQAGELPLPDEDDPTANWPLHKYAAYVFNHEELGPAWLEVELEHSELRFEELIDNAAELERRHFPHIAAVLRKVAANAKSDVDDIIEGEVGPWHRDPDARRRSLIDYWLRQRIKATGQSWNQLVSFYDLATDGWAELRDPDLV